MMDSKSRIVPVKIYPAQTFSPMRYRNSIKISASMQDSLSTFPSTMSNGLVVSTLLIPYRIGHVLLYFCHHVLLFLCLNLSSYILCIIICRLCSMSKQYCVFILLNPCVIGVLELIPRFARYSSTLPLSVLVSSLGYL